MLEGAEENKFENALQLLVLIHFGRLLWNNTHLLKPKTLSSIFFYTSYTIGVCDEAIPHTKQMTEMLPKNTAKGKIDLQEKSLNGSFPGNGVKIVVHRASLLSGTVNYDTDASKFNVDADHGQTPHGLIGRGAISNHKLRNQRLVTCGGVPNPMHPSNTNVSTTPKIRPNICKAASQR